ncbi:MAG: hypothetical protein AB8B85_08055 [Paracoccaceae bacterium]
MVWVLELAGVVMLLLVVWVLFRAARARPDEPSMRYVAWGSLIAWVTFAIITLIDFGYVRENTGEIGQTALILAVIGGIFVGYRMILSRLRDRAGS